MLRSSPLRRLFQRISRIFRKDQRNSTGVGDALTGPAVDPSASEDPTPTLPGAYWHRRGEQRKNGTKAF